MALAISPLPGTGITWNLPFQGQVRAAFPLPGMLYYKDKSRNLFLLMDVREEKSQHLLTRETLRKTYMNIFNLSVSFKSLHKWMLWIEIQWSTGKTVLPWESRWRSSIARYFLLSSERGFNICTQVFSNGLNYRLLIRSVFEQVIKGEMSQFESAIGSVTRLFPDWLPNCLHNCSVMIPLNPFPFLLLWVLIEEVVWRTPFLLLCLKGVEWLLPNNVKINYCRKAETPE